MKKKKNSFSLLLILLLMISASLCLGGCADSVNGEKEKQSDAHVSEDATQTKPLDDTKVSCKELTEYELSLQDDYRTTYEVFVRSFADGNGDGIGDLKGLTEKLDYLNDGTADSKNDLGISQLWLMPIMPSDTYHKYDVKDYMDIDPQYGTMADFENLSKECEKRNVRILIDLVMNHTSSKHPWFTSACDALIQIEEKGEAAVSSLEKNDAGNAVFNESQLNTCPYLAYYNFSLEKKSQAYREVPGSSVWYYEAQFDPNMPDLNLECQAVRDEFGSIVDFWFSKGVAGFRLDAVKEYVSGNEKKNTEILKWFCDMVKEKKEDAYLVAEIWTAPEVYAGYYESGIDSIFDFAFADTGGIIANSIKRAGGCDASSYGKALENTQNMYTEKNENYVDAPFYTNHDLGRSAGYYSGEYSEQQTKIAGAMNLLMSGNAFLYYGEEIGMKGAGKDENKRLAMRWNDNEKEPFQCESPDNADSVKQKYDDLATQMTDENSIYSYYKKLIEIRSSIEAVPKGKVTFLEQESNENVCSILKEYNDQKIKVIFNISDKEQKYELTDGEEVVCTLESGQEKAGLEGEMVVMPAYSVILCE